MPVEPSMGLSLREQQKRYTRQVVLDASVALIDRQGYAATTIDDIAQAAGTSRATIYSHFTGKDDIVRALASQMWSRATAFYTAFAELPDWEQTTIRVWLEDVAAVWEADRIRTRVVSEARGEEVRAEHVTHHRRFVKELIGDGRRWTHLSPTQAEARALALILQLETYFYTWKVAEYPLDREDLLANLAAIWLVTLSAPAPR
jgi:AcrR family transcriptional regulator